MKKKKLIIKSKNSKKEFKKAFRKAARARGLNLSGIKIDLIGF